MTEQQALAAIRRAASRRMWVSTAVIALIVLVAQPVWLAIQDGGWHSWRDVASTVITLALWTPFVWLLAWRPLRKSQRRLGEVEELVRGQVARIRAGFVTAEVPGERPREWRVGRRAKRLTMGDEVWLRSIGADDAPVVAVCVPTEGVPFVITDVPEVHTSLP